MYTCTVTVSYSVHFKMWHSKTIWTESIFMHTYSVHFNRKAIITHLHPQSQYTCTVARNVPDQYITGLVPSLINISASCIPVDDRQRKQSAQYILLWWICSLFILLFTTLYFLAYSNILISCRKAALPREGGKF